VTVVAVAVSGCSQQALQQMHERRRQVEATYSAAAQLAERHSSPRTIEHCKAQITGGKAHAIDYVEPWRFSPRAAEFVVVKIYSPAKPRPPGQLVAALINKCSGNNMLGFKVASYCGCFYEVDKTELRFVRTLSVFDFRQTNYH
jgi:hypothetical protein